MINEAELTNSSILAAQDHLFTELKEEGIILSLKNGKYYGVNEVGLSIWKAIQTPTTFSEVEKAILQEYDIDQATCRKEIFSFLNKMSEEDLIEISTFKDSRK